MSVSDAVMRPFRLERKSTVYERMLNDGVTSSDITAAAARRKQLQSISEAPLIAAAAASPKTNATRAPVATSGRRTGERRRSARRAVECHSHEDFTLLTSQPETGASALYGVGVALLLVSSLMVVLLERNAFIRWSTHNNCLRLPCFILGS